MYPQPPLIENVVVGAISYDGQVFWGLNADHDRVPDLGDFTRGLVRSFEALSVAAKRRAAGETRVAIGVRSRPA